MVSDFRARARSQVAFEFVEGRPARFQVGGFGGSRFLGIIPQPASWDLWSESSGVPPARLGVRFEELGMVAKERRHVVERSEPPSASGAIWAFAAGDDAARDSMVRLFAEGACRRVRDRESPSTPPVRKLALELR